VTFSPGDVIRLPPGQSSANVWFDVNCSRGFTLDPSDPVLVLATGLGWRGSFYCVLAAGYVGYVVVTHLWESL